MLPRLSPRGVLRAAFGLTIQDRVSGARINWRPYREQWQLWEMLCKHRALMVPKPRKIGVSTAVEHYVTLWVQSADADGHRVRAVTAINTDDKAKEHAAQYRDFARQMHMTHTPSSHGIRFPGGSEIVCLTGGGDDPGRGGTIHLLHVTELPYWRNPQDGYFALRSACSDEAQIIIDTTMTSIDPFTKGLWYGKNELHKHFWRVQDHESYRMDAELTDEEWELCQQEGFSDKRSAAWWLKHALPNICSGSMLSLMHDFPQREEHLFVAGVGRVVQKTPPLAPVIERVNVRGDFGDTWTFEVYGRYGPTGIERIPNSKQVVIPIDTAYGRKKTNSIVLAVDKETRHILAAFWSNEIKYDDLASIAGAMRQHFMPKKGEFGHDPTIVPEDDGIGDATCHALEKQGLPYERFTQAKDGNAEKCIVQAKRRIEAGLPGAPKILQDECDELHTDEKGEYKGRKDCIMAYGMANQYIELNPFRPRPQDRDPVERVWLKDRLVEDEGMAGGRRPKWGV